MKKDKANIANTDLKEYLKDVNDKKEKAERNLSKALDENNSLKNQTKYLEGKAKQLQEELQIQENDLILGEITKIQYQKENLETKIPDIDTPKQVK